MNASSARWRGHQSQSTRLQATMGSVPRMPPEFATDLPLEEGWGRLGWRKYTKDWRSGRDSNPIGRRRNRQDVDSSAAREPRTPMIDPFEPVNRASRGIRPRPRTGGGRRWKSDRPDSSE